MAESSSSAAPHPARILVSSTRKPISYINLAKRFLQEHGELQLSALGIAIAPMVTVAEILKSRGLAVEKRVATSLEDLSGDSRTRQKPKMEVLLTKSPDFDRIIQEGMDHGQQEPPRGAASGAPFAPPGALPAARSCLCHAVPGPGRLTQAALGCRGRAGGGGGGAGAGGAYA